MIPPELHAQIRRLFYAEHWRLNTIAAQLGVHHDTVRRAIESERFIRPGAQIRPSALDPYKTFLRATLEQYPRLRATRLWAMVRDRGYPGSVIQVQRYVRTVRPARTEAFLRLDTLPGEQAQVDWGHFGPIRVGSTVRSLSGFVLVLSWSRACYARFAFDQTLESFLRGHVEAFAALQGVPRTILYDNLKSVVLERVGDHIRFHPRLLEFAGHYHYAPQPCAVARGNEKGRVEKFISFLRHAFFAARPFSSVADLNTQLARWIAEVAHARPVPDRREQRVADALAEEQPRLLPLPEHPFPCDVLRASAPARPPTSASTAMTTRSPTPWSAGRSPSSPPSTRCASSTAPPRSPGMSAATIAAGASKTTPIWPPSSPRSAAPMTSAAATASGTPAPTPMPSSTPWPSAASRSPARPRACSTCSIRSAPPPSTRPWRRPSGGAPSAPPRSPTSSSSAAGRAGSPRRSPSCCPPIPACATCASRPTPSAPTTPCSRRRPRPPRRTPDGPTR